MCFGGIGDFLTIGSTVPAQRWFSSELLGFGHVSAARGSVIKLIRTEMKTLTFNTAHPNSHTPGQFVICHFCFFPWEMEEHVNEFHFSRQEELDASCRLGHRTFCLGAVITGLSVLCFSLLSLLSNRSTKGSCSVSSVMAVIMVLLFFYKNYNILLTAIVFLFISMRAF